MRLFSARPNGWQLPRRRPVSMQTGLAREHFGLTILLKRGIVESLSSGVLIFGSRVRSSIG